MLSETLDDLKRCAVPTGAYKGKRFYRFVVTVELGANAHITLQTEAGPQYIVHARNGREALEYVATVEGWDKVPATTLRTVGPRGGVARRFIGWETAIGNRMLRG